MIIASALLTLLTLLTSAAFAVLLLAIRDQRSSAQLARHSQEVLVAAYASGSSILALIAAMR
jgi:hypothetical protein